jgi:hypothetical protein
MTFAKDAQPVRISDDELKTERAKLETWCTPQDFHDKVNALAARFTLEDRFNSPRLAFLRDAVSLSEFSMKLGGAKSVRLATASDQFPDGFVTPQNGKTLQVEVTEADHEDRRRGDEYNDPDHNKNAFLNYTVEANHLSFSVKVLALSNDINQGYSFVFLDGSVSPKLHCNQQHWSGACGDNTEDSETRNLFSLLLTKTVASVRSTSGTWSVDPGDADLLRQTFACLKP